MENIIRWKIQEGCLTLRGDYSTFQNKRSDFKIHCTVQLTRIALPYIHLDPELGIYQERVSGIGSERLAIYLDDLCLYSKTYEQNLQIIEEVLRILRKNNLKIRAAKTEFLK